MRVRANVTRFKYGLARPTNRLPVSCHFHRVKKIPEGAEGVSYFGPSVLLGASGDEKPPSITVTGDPASSMPADTHLFQVCFEGASPYLLRRPLPLSFPSSYTLYIAVCAGLSLCILRTWLAIFILLVATIYWSRAIPALLVTSLFVTWSRHEMPRIARRQRRWKTSNL